MFKNTHIWILNYLKAEAKRLLRFECLPKPTHIMFCFVDHFEPEWNEANYVTQFKRVKQWMDKYPYLACKHRDADNCFPKHTFFYPAEVYNEEHLEALAKICRHGYGEVEVHLHHDDDTADGLRAKLEQAKNYFVKHGLLGWDKETKKIRYGFIHGNWALNNSRSDGRWCGVNNESEILLKTGCYADFTLPSAPSNTQTSKINSIYYDCGDASKPKSHKNGIDVKVGNKEFGRLMIIQGPLALNWKRSKFAIFLKLENGDITGTNLPTEDRIGLWVRQHIHVINKPEWIFIKVHTHGAQEKNMETLLGEPLDKMFSCLESKYNDGKSYVLHYVSARELYNIVLAAEAGETGNPSEYRDYFVEGNIK